MTGTTSDFILETDGLTKEFRGFVAVNDVNLRVRRGSIHTLIGPNGAGKTTCFNLLTKFLPPTRGSIRFNGTDITRESPAQVAQRGLVRSFQISAVFPHLSVLENVRVALQRKLGTAFQFWRSDRSLDQLNGQAMALLEQVGLGREAERRTVELAYGQKRALEIATTLALDPELMLLDEPTSGMGIEDVAATMHLIKTVSASRTILMVEHNMKIVAGISDTITVLSRGSVLAEGSYAQVSADPRVVEAYMGTEAAELPPTSHPLGVGDPRRPQGADSSPGTSGPPGPWCPGEAPRGGSGDGPAEPDPCRGSKVLHGSRSKPSDARA